jgi:hypothetical protein
MSYRHRFTNLRTMQDIKLEKAKLRYESLVAENRLGNTIENIQEIFSWSGIVSRFSLYSDYFSKAYHFTLQIIQKVRSWMHRSDDEQEQ